MLYSAKTNRKKNGHDSHVLQYNNSVVLMENRHCIPI